MPAVLRRLNAVDCEGLIIVNFANPDMVGHTGKLDAAITAVEVVDECVGRIVEATLARNGSLVVTASVIAFSEVARVARYANVALGIGLVVAAATFGGEGLPLIIRILCGVLLAALSLRKGLVRQHYGTWDRLIA